MTYCVTPGTAPTRMPLGRASAYCRPAGDSCPLTLTPRHIRVETVEGIVGELMGLRGNKVFQVVTPAR